MISFLIASVVGWSDFTFAVVKYRGGDWYNAKRGIRVFIGELAKRTSIKVSNDFAVVSLESDEMFKYPFLFLNGHAPVHFNDKEVKNLRTYLENGGFVFVNDDYGLDESFRREIKKVFPDRELVEIPFSHEIYRCFYKFPNGIPKIHEHYKGPPHAYGIFLNGRLVLFYAFNSDIGDGWDPPEVHHDPEYKRQEAIKMGVNIVVYALTH